MINKIFVDTNILIYFLDEDKTYFEKSKKFFEICVKEKIEIGISSLLIAEYLVGFYKEKQNDLSFFQFLESLNIQIYDVNWLIAKQSAILRNRYNEKLDDLIHIATAVENKYPYFLTNDQNLKKIIDVSVLNLDEFLEVIV